MVKLLLLSALLAPSVHAFNITTDEPIDMDNPSCVALGEALEAQGKPINTSRVMTYWMLVWERSITQETADELFKLHDECKTPKVE